MQEVDSYLRLIFDNDRYALSLDLPILEDQSPFGRGPAPQIEKSRDNTAGKFA